MATFQRRELLLIPLPVHSSSLRPLGSPRQLHGELQGRVGGLQGHVGGLRSADGLSGMDRPRLSRKFLLDVSSVVGECLLCMSPLEPYHGLFGNSVHRGDQGKVAIFPWHIAQPPASDILFLGDSVSLCLGIYIKKKYMGDRYKVPDPLGALRRFRRGNIYGQKTIFCF